MNHLIKRSLQGALLVGGLWVIGQGLASADTVSAPANAPVTVCGTSVGIFGSPTAGCPSDAGSTSSATAGDISAPVTVPVSITGNSIGVGQPADTTTTTSTTGTAGTAPAGSGTMPSTGSAGDSERAGECAGGGLRKRCRGIRQPVRQLPVHRW